MEDSAFWPAVCRLALADYKAEVQELLELVAHEDQRLGNEKMAIPSRRYVYVSVLPQREFFTSLEELLTTVLGGRCFLGAGCMNAIRLNISVFCDVRLHQAVMHLSAEANSAVL